MKAFVDRQEAGALLGHRLEPALLGRKAIVIAITRGGVCVAEPIARRLGVPLDLLVVRKLGAPNQPELAIGAVASGGLIYLNQELIGRLGVTEEELERVKKQELAELHTQEAHYFNLHPHLAWSGMHVVLVDDGIATGATMEVAIRAVKAAKAGSIVVAVPVAAISAIERLHLLVEQVCALQTPSDLQSVGQFYQSFPQVKDQDVLDILDVSRREISIHDHA